MVFVVVILCFALGLEFEEFNGILIYIYIYIYLYLYASKLGSEYLDLLLIWDLERVRNRGMRGKRVGRETGPRKK